MTQLGRFEVIKPLSRGSMADLLLARTTGSIHEFQRHVVIKQIRPELARDDKLVKMFLDEARLSASLHHQNIVQVYDVGEQDGAYFFAMEYVHGEDLRTIMQNAVTRGETIPLEVVCLVLIAAAAGLHHAHEKVGPDRTPLGIIHRDVSPSNVLVGYDGSVKLVDFGLAKAKLRSATTHAGTRKGKAGYMSPEQCRGLTVDRRSDVFGLGIVLYEALTARRLFKAENEFLTMTAIVQGAVPPPSTLRPDLPKQLDDITLHALAKAPEQRYQDADQLREALERFMVEAQLRRSPMQLSEYMKRVFGERVEPWLSARPTPYGALDYDTPNAGLVNPPESPDPDLLPRDQTTLTEEGSFPGDDETVASPPPDFAREDTGTSDRRGSEEDSTTLPLHASSFAEEDEPPTERLKPKPKSPVGAGPVAPASVASPAGAPGSQSTVATVRGARLRATQPFGIAIVCAVVAVVTAVLIARC
jgi:serine/threonine-protein kinase